MCILFIAVNQHPEYPLIIAANRDEFHQRPTLVSDFWPSYPNLLAGKDETAGGTWMGINKAGRIAALTNIRAPGKDRENARSRGELAINYLTHNVSSDDYMQTLMQSHLDYNGYNLLFGELTALKVYNSFDNSEYDLKDGVYGLSNASLNSPWPKLDAGRSALANYCQHADILSQEHLFDLLKNMTPAADKALPKTGIPIEWERKLSSIFIQSNDYGTRSSTLLLVDKQNKVSWEERSFNAQAEVTATMHHEFVIA
jgi:uncharacterized protein with NRDE domain